MSRSILRNRRDICQLCDFIITQKPHPVFLPRIPFHNLHYSTVNRRSPQSSSITRLPAATVTAKEALIQPREITKAQNSVTQTELENDLQKLGGLINQLFAKDRAITETEALFVLDYCKVLAVHCVPESPPSSQARKDGAASVLLSLDESSKTKRIPLHKLPSATRQMAGELSEKALSVMKHPNVFITPKVLEVYTAVQSRLGKPESFPETFEMYANKPIPEERSTPVKFSKQNPNKAANAVPLAIANVALQSAIDAKQLVIAMDIIDSAYTKSAFLRAKFIRQGLLPATALTMSPFAAWIIASKLAELQTTMEPAMATNVAFAGILAYVGFTAVIGVVAVTTANDQMDRVTWAPGMPLRQRWIREDERAAIDRIAGAWGFRESWRKGEEEGEDWENLREWIGRRGMILDRVSLMEGME